MDKGITDMKEPKTFPLKDWFGPELARQLGEKIKAVHPGFPQTSFEKEFQRTYQDHELKGRVGLLAAGLKKHLPPSYEEGLSVLMKIIGPENENETGMFKEGYWLMPVAKYIEEYGLETPDLSLTAIYELTKRHTGEFAIRPYIIQYPDTVVAVMQQWVNDPNFHVRRLASEGLRPRLPWANKLTLFLTDPSPVFQILDTLMEDPVMFVKKSVANNLNDYLKDNEQAAWNFIEQWKNNEDKNTRWILKHALRNKIKQQDPKALALIGHFKS